MDWIQNQTNNYEAEVSLLKRLDKLTIYDHNYTLKKNPQNLTLTGVFNCKKMNRQYSIIGKIEGDLTTRNFEISCMLLSFGKIVVGKWNYQKIELAKFAYKYNQKNTVFGKISEESENYQIKVNPTSGEFYVSFQFVLTPQLLKDIQQFKVKMTDQCSKLGNEAEKIFNTILQVIFFQEANDPYLKSDERIGVQYSKPVKIGKLLRKIKKMSTLSQHYKIKQDISAPNKLRSLFKKIYIKKKEKTISNPLIIENAVVFIPKFSSKHIDALYEATSSAKKKTQMIIPFEELADTLEIQFARHLDENLIMERPLSQIPIELNKQQYEVITGQPGFHNLQFNDYIVPIYTQEIEPALLAYEHLVLSKIGPKHPNMIQYYSSIQCNRHRITEFFHCMKLEDFLNQSSKNLSLSAKLDLMAQICHLIEYLHKSDIGFFLDFNDIYITEGNVIKVKNFSSAYSTTCWDESRQEKKTQRWIMPHAQDFKNVAGYRGDEPTTKDVKDSGKQDPIEKKLENERADVFCLGMVLYRILMDKFPFHPNSVSLLYSMGDKIEEYLSQIWTLETQSFLRQGGMVAKLLGQLLLKCFHMDCSKRPFVEWMTVIICETKTSLENLY